MRVSGVIGYGIQQKIRPGVIEDVITERKYRGDVLRPSVGIEQEEKVNDDLRVGNQISVVASAFHSKHISTIRYITFMGIRWKVTNIEVTPSRLNMRMGGVYHGPTP